MRPELVHQPVPKICVRPAAPGDLGALITLEQQVFVTDRLSRRSLRRLLQSPSAAVIVAQDTGGVLVGNAILLFRPRSTRARLYSIAVMPSMSGQGIGAQLLQAAEQVVLGRGCNAIRLEVHQTNRAAVSRYRKSGYHEFGRHHRYYEDGGDALRFEKQLGRQAEATSHSRALPAGR